MRQGLPGHGALLFSKDLSTVLGHMYSLSSGIGERTVRSALKVLLGIWINPIVLDRSHHGLRISSVELVALSSRERRFCQHQRKWMFQRMKCSYSPARRLSKHPRKSIFQPMKCMYSQPIAEILATPTPIDNSGNEAQLPPRAETDATPTQVDHSANELQLSQSPMSRRPDWLPVGWELTKHTSCRNKNGNLRGAFLHTASGKVVLNKDRVLKLDRALP